jgi:hypothetical protein
MSRSIVRRDPKKDAAAQNAQEGVVTVSDLSLLTGIAEAQLTKFAKLGLLEHYGEYHGKRFFNFQKIVNWAVRPGEEDEARKTVRKGMETELLNRDCPYSFEKLQGEDNAEPKIKILWKVTPEPPLEYVSKHASPSLALKT